MNLTHTLTWPPPRDLQRGKQKQEAGDRFLPTCEEEDVVNRTLYELASAPTKGPFRTPV